MLLAYGNKSMLKDFLSPVTDNLNVILHLSTSNTVYIRVFMIMPQFIINTYVSLMYELNKTRELFMSKSAGTGLVL
jgi:hypothetical protein